MNRKVLVIGDMRYGTNARSVVEGYLNLASVDVRWVDTSPSVGPRLGTPDWRSIHHSGLVSPETQARLVDDLRQALEHFRPDLLLAIKTIHYDQRPLLDINAGVHAHLSFDDVSNTFNTTPTYLSSECEWDLVITNKQHNINELKLRGVKDVLYLWGAYDPRMRYFFKPTIARKYTLGFIGVARPDRRNLPRTLAERAPGRAVVYGPRWRRWYPIPPRGLHLKSAVYGSAYNEAANDIRVGLLLLNSENRDQHTNRTFEMPATGQVVLGQRTPEHEVLFEDGKEALLFQGNEEMWSLLARLNEDVDFSANIALNGRRRITEGANTYTHRAAETLRYIGLSGEAF